MYSNYFNVIIIIVLYERFIIENVLHLLKTVIFVSYIYTNQSLLNFELEPFVYIEVFDYIKVY